MDHRKPLFKQSRRKIDFISNGYYPKEIATFVCKMNLNVYIPLIKEILSQLKCIVSIFIEYRLIFVALHSFDAEQIERDRTAFIIESNFILHSRKTILYNALKFTLRTF
jgi:hypothetical protein